MKKESSRHVRRKRVPLLERDDGAGCEVPFGAAGGSAKRRGSPDAGRARLFKESNKSGWYREDMSPPLLQGGDGAFLFSPPVFIVSFLGGSFSL